MAYPTHPVDKTKNLPLNGNLLLPVQLPHEGNRHANCLRHHVGRRQRQPLRERDVGHPVGLVDLHPDQILASRVLDVVALFSRIPTLAMCTSKEGKGREEGGVGGLRRGTDPELSGNTAVSPARKSKVRAFCVPRKTVARASPLQKKSHSAAYTTPSATFPPKEEIEKR